MTAKQQIVLLLEALIAAEGNPHIQSHIPCQKIIELQIALEGELHTQFNLNVEDDEVSYYKEVMGVAQNFLSDTFEHVDGLRSQVGTITPEITAAIQELCNYHPECAGVVFFRDGKWKLVDEDHNPLVTLDGQIDIHVLELAADSLNGNPAIFEF